jgi:hypothetical protein
LEFKVVTPDGKYRIANKIANPDLFWALRGGGGGTFGVVVEATVKAYPHVPITAYGFWLNSSSVGLGSSLLSSAGWPSPGEEGLKKVWEHLGRSLPGLGEKATSAYIYPGLGSLRGVAITVGENATTEYMTSIWKPVLDKMKSFRDIKEPQTQIFHFDNYQEFFDYTYQSGMTTGCYREERNKGKARRDGMKESQTVIDTPGCSCKPAAMKRDQGGLAQASAAHCTSLEGDTRESSLRKRHGPGEMDSMTSFLDPVTPGIMNLDSVLLGKRHFDSPQFPKVLRDNPTAFGWLLVSGNKAHRPDDDVSVHPAWRTASVHAIGLRAPGMTMKPWQKFASDSGAYGNEVCFLISN